MEHNFIDLFAGTFLDGFFQLQEDEYLEPSVEKGKTEVVIGKMSDAEKRIYTLVCMKHVGVKKLSLKFWIDEEDLDTLINSHDLSLLDEAQEKAEYQYKAQDLEFPWDIWERFVERLESFQILTYFLDSLIYTRLMPRFICLKPIFRAGFLIVKDDFEVIEDDGSFEDGEKIVNQNFPFN